MPEIDYTLAPVEKGAKKSLSRQIEELIIRNIEAGNLAPGSKLPTEREVCQRFGVARGTVKTAYHHLAAQGAIRMRQGSGSYVARSEELLYKLHRDEAERIFMGAIADAQKLELKPYELREVFDICMARNVGKVVNVAIVSPVAEMLLDYKKQLSALPNTTVSIFFLENITESPDPRALLGRFDLILVPSYHYSKLITLAPSLSGRIMETATGPSHDTLVGISALPRQSRIGIICRTNTFLVVVRDLLLSYGFLKENIQHFLEMDYTIETYFPGGIDALISFSDAHIFTDEGFTFRNEEFWAKGGIIIPFVNEIERGSIYFIEDQVRRLMLEANPG